ncbi:hypothetical protein ACFCVO_09465 [Agromyces sp. NPDC056379]|uniref:hypothetical protein n=1 Tax=unclassified Agromyces TaxID=2639701 RepID=UPI0035E1FA6A
MIALGVSVLLWGALLIPASFLLGEVGVSANGAFHSETERFAERRLAAEEAIAISEAEISFAAATLDAPSERIGAAARSELDRARIAARRELDRLAELLQSQIEEVRAARPLLPPELAPHVWMNAAERIHDLPVPSNIDFQAETTALYIAGDAVDRDIEEWKREHADELREQLRSDIAEDAGIGRGAPDTERVDGFDRIVHVTSYVEEPDPSECAGAVDLADVSFGARIIGEMWECGGADFPRWEGATVRLSGLEYSGAYRVEGTVAYLDVWTWDPADLPVGYDLFYETYLEERDAYVYVGLTKLESLPDLPNPFSPVT